MKLSSGHPFRKHSDNLASIKKGLTQIQRSHKDAIRKGDRPRIEVLARLHMFTVGLAAEAYLRKIIADPDGFNDLEREILRRERAQVERWRLAVQLAFRRHYSIPVHLELRSPNLPSGVETQLKNIDALLTGDLRAIIEDRNKIAHAQWVWRMNSDETKFETAKAPRPYNYLATDTRWRIIDLLGRLVNVLVVSEPTFQRDFNALYGSILGLQPHLSGSGYSQFAKTLKATRTPVRYGATTPTP